MLSDVMVVVTASHPLNSLEQHFTIAISAAKKAAVALTYLHNDEDITDSLSLYLTPCGDTSTVPTILDIPATFCVRKTKVCELCLLIEDADGKTVSRTQF